VPSFEVRWKTLEKKHNGGVVRKTVVNALRSADAVIIVTGMASHALMHFAKEYAQKSGIPWRCVDKATDKQLRVTLQGLFPDLTADWNQEDRLRTNS
jgi:hypothetical protein